MAAVSEAIDIDEIAALLPRSLHAVMDRFVQETPDHIAVVDDRDAWSYRELDKHVQEVARQLASLGVRAGDRMMIVSESCIALAALLFAASQLDAWAIVAGPRLSAREIDQIRDHSGARGLFFTTSVSNQAAAHAARLNAEIRNIGPLKEVGFSGLNLATLAEPLEDDPAKQIAVLIYTSGTTPTPKGVMPSHENLLISALTTAHFRKLSARDRVYVVLPATDQRLLEDKVLAGIKRLDYGSLRLIVVAGAPLDVALKSRVEAELGLPLSNGYGIAECAPGISGVRFDEPRADNAAGKVLPGVEARVRTLDGLPLGNGEVGELHVRGRNVMRGCHRAPDLTAKAIDGEGWFNTGDLARFEGDCLYIVGRTKEMIIRSGFNVYPAEIEAIPSSHKDVVQSTVVGRPVEGNEEVVAFVQLIKGSKTRAGELADFLKQQFAAYKRPSEIILLDALPATSTGKILKHQLAQSLREPEKTVAVS